MRFTKMQGIGNDYVFVDASGHIPEDPAALARRISDRHFGVGSDGLILLLPSTVADIRMRMFNSDGTESEMCGNGIRCLAKFAWEQGHSRSNPMRIETGRGVRLVQLHVDSGKVSSVTVNMGEPILPLNQIPVDAARLARSGKEHEYRLEVPQIGESFNASFISVGNPHAIIYVDDVGKIDLPRIGPLLEHHSAFPRRMNIHFVQIESPLEITMRTWERGSGITLACGTGACAVCVSGVITGRTGRKIVANLPGGDLSLEWVEAENCVYMTGPAVEVFSGEWNG